MHLFQLAVVLTVNSMLRMAAMEDTTMVRVLCVSSAGPTAHAYAHMYAGLAQVDLAAASTALCTLLLRL